MIKSTFIHIIIDNTAKDDKTVYALMNKISDFFELLDLYQHTNINGLLFDYIFFDEKEYSFSELELETLLCRKSIHKFVNRCDDLAKSIIDYYDEFLPIKDQLK